MRAVLVALLLTLALVACDRDDDPCAQHDRDGDGIVGLEDVQTVVREVRECFGRAQYPTEDD